MVRKSRPAHCHPTWEYSFRPSPRTVCRCSFEPMGPGISFCFARGRLFVAVVSPVVSTLRFVARTPAVCFRESPTGMMLGWLSVDLAGAFALLPRHQFLLQQAPSTPNFKVRRLAANDCLLFVGGGIREISGRSSPTTVESFPDLRPDQKSCNLLAARPSRRSGCQLFSFLINGSEKSLEIEGGSRRATHGLRARISWPLCMPRPSAFKAKLPSACSVREQPLSPKAPRGPRKIAQRVRKINGLSSLGVRFSWPTEPTKPHCV
ncbi:hypothetical protein VTI28DRAFT_5933 [Corynascus sepedonium]